MDSPSDIFISFIIALYFDLCNLLSCLPLGLDCTVICPQVSGDAGDNVFFFLMYF